MSESTPVTGEPAPDQPAESLLCDVCREAAFRYKCPRCLKKTCCLACVKRHKTTDGCSGVRDKTAYVGLKQYSEMNLLNDYRFLEDVVRKADSASRDPASRKHDRAKIIMLSPSMKHWKSPGVAITDFRLRSPSDISVKQKMLVREARRRDITLKIMPYGFNKRKQNRTWYLKKCQKMLWHVEFYFVHAEAKYTDKVEEDLCLGDVLNKFLHPTESEPVIQQHLKMYTRAGGDGVRVFMKQEGLPANCIKYDELDAAKTITENLSGKTVVEYPTFHIVLNERAGNYTDKLDVTTSKPPVHMMYSLSDRNQPHIVSAVSDKRQQPNIVSPELVDKEQSSNVSPEHIDKNESSVLST